VRLRRFGSEAWEDIPHRIEASMGRGIGLAEMAEAIRADRPHRASGELGYHVLDVLLSLEEATRSGGTESVSSRVPRPVASI
jgi:hypothetical protein